MEFSQMGAHEGRVRPCELFFFVATYVRAKIFQTCIAYDYCTCCCDGVCVALGTYQYDTVTSALSYPFHDEPTLRL